MLKDSKAIGIELSQLARFLFDDAANNWYLAIILQVVAGVLGAVFSLANSSDEWKLFFAVILFIVTAWAYYLRIKFDEKYDRAETMRRQAALSEGLGLSIGPAQASMWRQRVGSKILNRFDREPRNVDYYATNQQIGPKRLLEMTIESAFYTRHLYGKLKTLIWILFVISVAISLLVLTVLPFNFVPKSLAIKTAYSLYLLLPILLSVDLLLWGLRLDRLISSIFEIEKDMDKLYLEENLHEAHVIRLVSEYNCQVACGMPIHNVLFKFWHKDIDALWKRRNS